MKTPPTFIPAIHSIRGIASLAVFFKHIFAAPFITVPAITGFFWYGQLGVHAFFVISGFVLPYALFQRQYRTTDFFTFLGQRLLRLEPPYLVAVVLATGYLWLGTLYPTAIPLRVPPSPKELLLHVGYLIPLFKDTQWVNMVFWTLAIEFQYYLLLAFTFPLLLSRNKYQRWLFYLLFSMPTLFLKGQIITYLPLFLLGTVGALWVRQEIRKPELLVVLVLVAVQILVGIHYLIGISSLLTLGVILFLPGLGGKILTFLGDISYSLYLTHFVTAMALHNLVLPQMDSLFGKVLVFSGGIVFALAFAYVFYLFIEKPAKKAARNFEWHAFYKRMTG